MVFFFALTAKSAITAGLLIGGTVALYANKDKIAEFLEQEWEKFSNERISMACNMKDGQFRGLSDEKNASFSESEATTPEATDAESNEDDLESPVESFDEKGHNLNNPFENDDFETSEESHMEVILSGSEYEDINSDLDDWGASTANSGELNQSLKHRKKLPVDSMLYESSTDLEPWEDSLD